MVKNIPSSLIPPSPPTIIPHTTHDPRLNLTSTNRFHHSQMLQIVMGLEERITSEEFNKYTPNTPYITRIAPAQIEDDFGSTVMTRGDDAGVVFIVKSGGAEIDEPDFGVEEDFSLIGAAGGRVR